MRRNSRTLWILSTVITAALLSPLASAQTLKTTLIASAYTKPLYVCSPPGDIHRLFVVEQDGRIRIIKNGLVLTLPFLDITAQVVSGGEQGLLGMAFHPSYASNGRFYVSYTDTSGASVVRQYHVSANPDVGDPASFTTIFGPLAQPQSNHNGGCLQFSRDGFLYYGLGDGGGANDSGAGHAPGGNAQSPSTYLGKMLRLDVDAPAPYVPASNPFANPNDGVLDLIWALRTAQSVALQLRPQHRRPVHRRRRTRNAGGNRLPTRCELRRRELRLELHGGLELHGQFRLHMQ